MLTVLPIKVMFHLLLMVFFTFKNVSDVALKDIVTMFL